MDFLDKRVQNIQTQQSGKRVQTAPAGKFIYAFPSVLLSAWCSVSAQHGLRCAGAENQNKVNGREKAKAEVRKAGGGKEGRSLLKCSKTEEV